MSEYLPYCPCCGEFIDLDNTIDWETERLKQLAKVTKRWNDRMKQKRKIKQLPETWN